MGGSTVDTSPPRGPRTCPCYWGLGLTLSGDIVLAFPEDMLGEAGDQGHRRSVWHLWTTAGDPRASLGPPDPLQLSPQPCNAAECSSASTDPGPRKSHPRQKERDARPPQTATLQGRGALGPGLPGQSSQRGACPPLGHGTPIRGASPNLPRPGAGPSPARLPHSTSARPARGPGIPPSTLTDIQSAGIWPLGERHAFVKLVQHLLLGLGDGVTV